MNLRFTYADNYLSRDLSVSTQLLDSTIPKTLADEIPSDLVSCLILVWRAAHCGAFRTWGFQESTSQLVAHVADREMSIERDKLSQCSKTHHSIFFCFKFVLHNFINWMAGNFAEETCSKIMHPRTKLILGRKAVEGFEAIYEQTQCWNIGLMVNITELRSNSVVWDLDKNKLKF